MDRAFTAALVALSYLVSLLVYRRFRIAGARAEGLPVERLRGVHVAAVFAPVVADAPALAEVAALAAEGSVRNARDRFAPLAGALAPARRLCVASALDLVEAGREPGRLRRMILAGRARRLARRGSRLEPSAALDHLWLQAALGFLTDATNLELVLWTSGRRLRRALRRDGHSPLLHLSAALRAAVAGETAEALQALGRALYHARGDRFVAELIGSLPRLRELSPGLAAQASAALAATPRLPPGPTTP